MEMSGGDGDVEPYLYSRNTIGHRNHNPKSQRPKRVKIVIGGIRGCWWCMWAAVVVWVLEDVVENREVVVAELETFSFVRFSRTSGW